MVVFNNARYAAVRSATLSMFASGAAGRDNGLGLADLSPSPPFEKEAEAYGAFAARVERPADLPKVLAAARKVWERQAPRARQRDHSVLSASSSSRRRECPKGARGTRPGARPHSSAGASHAIRR